MPLFPAFPTLWKVIALALISTLPSSVLAQQDKDFPNTYEYLLDNGLKLIVREDHRAPVVTTMVWYKVGSVDEPRGLGGLSHMLEHMMFKGTPTLKPNEHSTIVANLGGRDNAFTSTDFTAYFETLPAWELETSLRLEADRMQNLVLREEDFTPERLVVAEERRQRTDSNPQALFYEAFNATVWTTSAYRNPIIGWMPEIHSWTLANLQDWYQRYYAPNNAVLVIVGDVDVQQTYALTKKYFAAIPKSTTLEYPHEFEVPQTAEKRINMAAKANLPVLFMAYKTPSIITAADKNEVYALMLAAEILSGSQSARLNRTLVKEQQIALQASSYYNEAARYDTTFMFSAVPAENIELAVLETALKAAIVQLQTTLVSQAELDRILNAYRAGKIYAQDSIYYQAMQIGTAETIGEGWRHRENILTYLSQVTPEMIQQVSQKYLTNETLTVGTLHPIEPDSATKEQ